MYTGHIFFRPPFPHPFFKKGNFFEREIYPVRTATALSFLPSFFSSYAPEREKDPQKVTSKRRRKGGIPLQSLLSHAWATLEEGRGRRRERAKETRKPFLLSTPPYPGRKLERGSSSSSSFFFSLPVKEDGKNRSRKKRRRRRRSTLVLQELPDCDQVRIYLIFI